MYEEGRVTRSTFQSATLKQQRAVLQETMSLIFNWKSLGYALENFLSVNVMRKMWKLSLRILRNHKDDHPRLAMA